MNLDEAILLFDQGLQGEVSERTREWYRHKLLPLLAEFGDTPINNISAEALRAWRAALSDRPISPHTLHGHVRACKRFFKWLAEEQYLPANPAERLKKPRLPEEPPKAITEESFQRLLATAQQQANSPGAGCWPARDLALLLFLADTGCRVAGATGLKLKDIDLAAREATVREKGAKARLVYFGQKTADALQSWLACRPRAKSDLVFIGRRSHNRLHKSIVLRILRALAARAGVTGRCNPHALRHAFALRLLDNGADMGTVSDLMGHTDIKVTHDYYARWTPGERKARHQRFSGLE